MIQFEHIFDQQFHLKENIIFINENEFSDNQDQTKDTFSFKWESFDQSDEKEKTYQFQKDWYLKLYGFKSETDLADYLKKVDIVFDAGCGLGYKASWFAELSPQTTVIGMDISDSVFLAAKNYKHLKNLFFIKGSIAETPFKNHSIDYVSCDQVIMHTDNPEQTFSELSRITKKGGEFACYVYRKKAIPRELLDDFFRDYCKEVSQDDLMEFSKQMTQLGKTLSELNINLEVPEIPLLRIKGGEYDLQRFIYWNFIKCFWNKELGLDSSVMTNFDWYSPSNAKRFSEEEFRLMISSNQLEIKYFHEEEACYSGRFTGKV